MFNFCIFCSGRACSTKKGQTFRVRPLPSEITYLKGLTLTASCATTFFNVVQNFIFLFVLWGIFLALASIVILALINLGLLVTVHNFLIIYTGSMVGLIISLYYSLTLFLAYKKDYRQKTKDYRL